MSNEMEETNLGEYVNHMKDMGYILHSEKIVAPEKELIFKNKKGKYITIITYSASDEDLFSLTTKSYVS